MHISQSPVAITDPNVIYPLQRKNHPLEVDGLFYTEFDNTRRFRVSVPFSLRFAVSSMRAAQSAGRARVKY